MLFKNRIFKLSSSVQEEEGTDPCCGCVELIDVVPHLDVGYPPHHMESGRKNLVWVERERERERLVNKLEAIAQLVDQLCRCKI